MKFRSILLAVCACFASAAVRSADAPVRFAIVGLVHDHARGFIPLAKARQDVQLVAIVEPNQEFARRYAQTPEQLDASLFYTNLDEMLDKANVQAVATFTNTFDHRRWSRCGPAGRSRHDGKAAGRQHKDARAIGARPKGKIHVLVNYETTWYREQPSRLRPAFPRRIGDTARSSCTTGTRAQRRFVSAEFLAWLTDPS